MVTAYENPPLIEALCEFRFRDSSEWDITLPGLFYTRMRDEFPMKREQAEFQVEVKGKASPDVKSTPKVMFLSKDEKRLVQVSPGLLAVNHLKPYPTWNVFRDMIFSVVERYLEVATPSALARIGLRYINRIEIGQDQNPRDAFAYYPSVPEPIDRKPSNLLLRSEFSFPECNGRLILTLASTPPESAESNAFILDLDFITLDTASITLQTATDWVQTAHERVEMAFEASISDELRDRFNKAIP